MGVVGKIPFELRIFLAFDEKCVSTISGVEGVLSILAADANQRWFMTRPPRLVLLPSSQCYWPASAIAHCPLLLLS